MDVEGMIGRDVARDDVLDGHRDRFYRAFFALGDDAQALMLHWTLFTSLIRDLRDDGHPIEMPPLPPVPMPRRMWAGGEIRWVAPIVEGAALTRTTTVARAVAKEGRTGPFLLTSLTHVVAGPGGVTLVEERQDIVFLPEAARPGAAPPQPPGFDAQWQTRRRFGPIDLFRYSAMTLNSHRIHYDVDYARDVEGYRGVVVHGPLLATTLAQEAVARSPGRYPAVFSYRAVSPALAGDALTVVGREEPDGSSRLAAVGEDGGVRMSAAMTFGDRA